MNLHSDCNVKIKQNVSLKPYCTMQVGGPAAYFAQPVCEQELQELVAFAASEALPYFILGKGSNVIFADSGYPGLVISMTHYDEQKIVIDKERNTVTAASGVYLYKLSLACRDAGLAGTEFLASIPGTLGGAVVMNAGYSRFPGQTNEIGDLVESVQVLSAEGKRMCLERPQLQFAYRSSNLNDFVVLSVTLQLWARPGYAIEKEIRANFDYRNAKQDMTKPSSGSIFKNPPKGKTAGMLIEETGLKGLRVGSAMISEKHGNYIVNLGGATARDIHELIKKVQSAVLNEKEIYLEPEVRIIQGP